MAAGKEDPRRMLGGFIRAQRQMANLSLRQLSALAEVSNPYLSQVERGLHEPSVRVLRSIADALNVSAETLHSTTGLDRTGDVNLELALRFGDRLWAGCWHGGVRIIDVADIKNPRTIGAYNYHPPFPEPSHTFMGVPFPVAGRQIALAIDEEDHAHDGAEMERRRGRPHACLWVFDVSDPAQIQP